MMMKWWAEEEESDGDEREDWEAEARWWLWNEKNFNEGDDRTRTALDLAVTQCNNNNETRLVKREPPAQ